MQEQTTSRFPFRWCGMKPTVSGISQLDELPGPHRGQEEALDTSEPRDANPHGNKMMTRLGRGARPRRNAHKVRQSW
jgi:hypothetical protein